MNHFKILGGRAEYGGQVVQLEFDRDATMDDLDQAAHTVDKSCPFGWRVIAGKGKHWTIKIHND